MAASIQIRRAVERLEARGRGIRYPSELKTRLVSETRNRTAGGETLKAIGEDLGVSWRTLARWCAEGGRGRRAFRSVEVVAVPSATPTVHGPRGLRIEGLDLDGVAELIRRLA